VSHDNRRAFWQGVKDLLPLVPGVIPFGLIAGASGVALGFSPQMIMGMTILFHAGSAQLIAYQLIQENASFFIIVLTAVVVNLRFAIYSATFAPLLSPLKIRFKLPLAYLLSDQTYGLCSQPNQMARTTSQRVWYFAGTAIALWFFWVCSVLFGIAIGASIPPQWELSFTIPLAFLAMLVTSIRSRLMLLVAIAAGSSAVLLKTLPYNLGFIAAVIGGVFVGLLLANLFKRPSFNLPRR
jgi:predicted branched-subunit amino acid permease